MCPYCAELGLGKDSLEGIRYYEKMLEDEERLSNLSMNPPAYADLRGTAAWELFTHTHKREARAVLKWEREVDELDRKINWVEYE